jgi:hypothetical protein
VNLHERARLVTCVTSRPQPQLTMIELGVAFGCLETVGPIRAAASYRFDKRGDGTVNSIDRAPNHGQSPALHLEA